MTRRKQNQGVGSGTGRRVESNTRVQDAYRSSRVRRGLDPDDAWLIGAALDLKRDYLDSPNPGVWAVDVLTELLGDVIPRTVLLDTQDRAVLIDTVEDFLQFLADSGRWAPESFPASRIRDVVAGLRPGVDRALTEPSRRSITTNIVQYGQSQGVDFSDHAQVQRFIEDYNALGDAERTQVSEGHRPSQASPFGLGPFGQGPGGAPGFPDWPDDDDGIDYKAAFQAGWPDILGDPLDLEAMVAPLADGLDIEHQLAAMDLPLLDRADRLMAWLGAGRPVTQTGALRLAQTQELAELFGLPTLSFKSMWEVHEVAAPWHGLVDAGFIDLGSTMARPNPDTPWPDPDTAITTRAVFRGSVVLDVLLDLLAPEEDEGLLKVPSLALLALLKAAQPSGLKIPERRPGPDLRALHLGLDLRVLERVGLITVNDGVAHAPAELAPLLLKILDEAAGSPG